MVTSQIHHPFALLALKRSNMGTWIIVVYLKWGSRQGWNFFYNTDVQHSKSILSSIHYLNKYWVRLQRGGSQRVAVASVWLKIRGKAQPPNSNTMSLLSMSKAVGSFFEICMETTIYRPSPLSLFFPTNGMHDSQDRLSAQHCRTLLNHDLESG